MQHTLKFSAIIFLLTMNILFGKSDMTFSKSVHVLDDEKWWFGVVSQAHLMPFGQEPFEIDLYGNTAWNQVQPLLISNMGRFIWSEHPFAMRYDGQKNISISSNFEEPIIGQHGTTLKEVYRYVSETYFPPSGKIPDALLFTTPQFNTWIEFTYYQSQDKVLDYARNIVDRGFAPGVLMIDEGWANDYGDWDFDPLTFPDPKAMMTELHNLGFKLMLWVCPYITSDGQFYKRLYLDHVNGKKTVWLTNGDNPKAPAILNWWNGYSAVIDLSNPDGYKFLKDQLDFLVEEYGVDGFKLDGGDAAYYDEPSYLSPVKSYADMPHPNYHSELFAKIGLDYPLNEYRACWKMGGQPLAQRLRDKRHSWEDLRMLIPGMINLGLMGYPFSCPDMIGGGEYLSFIDLSAVDQELVVRAAQCHALMPMMQFSVAPWRVLDAEHFQACKEAADLHTQLGEEILALATLSAQTGEPIVTTLEYHYPHSGYADINDQFLVGETILVAPVLQKDARTREIVFPPGTWIGDDGSTVKGPKTVAVDTPLNRLPWYRLQK